MDDENMDMDEEFDNVIILYISGFEIFHDSQPQINLLLKENL